LSEENVDGLLEQAEGKTKEEVKEIVAALRPKPAAEPMIRRKPATRSLESRFIFRNWRRGRRGDRRSPDGG
jgi:hypothetical protein